MDDAASRPLRFSARRTGHRGWMAAGLVALLGGFVATGIAVAVMHERAESLLPFTMLATMAVWWICWIIAAIPRRATLEVVSGGIALRPGNPASGAPARHFAVASDEVVMGGWTGPVGAAVGVVAHVGPPGRRRLRIGGRDLTGLGYRLDAPATRRVDVELEGADFERLLRGLAVPHDAQAQDLDLELTPSRFGPRAVFAMMGPWILTLVILSIGGVVLGVSGLGDRLSEDATGRALLAVGTIGIVALGIGFQVWRATRPPRAAYRLRVGQRSLALIDRAGRELASAAWHAVRAERFTHRYRVKGFESKTPGLELTIGDHHPLRIGAWDPSQEWPGSIPTTRHGARWLIGAPQWKVLVRALREH